MKPFPFGFGLLALVAACLVNILINTGCATKTHDERSSFKLEGVERAAGPQYDVPIAY